MKLAYRAYDKTGREIADTIEASNPGDAVESLREKGLFVRVIHPDRTPGGAQEKATRELGRGRRLKNLAMFTRQLYVLLSSGTSLVEAMGALERQTKDSAWRGVILDVRSQVEEGKSLAEAMACRAECFDPVYRSLIAAGESSGQLGQVLDRLASLARKRLHVRNSVIGAIIYPSMLLVISVFVLGLLLTFVVPRFAVLFETLDAPMPPTTQLLIGASDFVRSYWWLLLGLACGSVFGVKLWARTSNGSRAIDTLLLRLPQAGRISKSFITARIIRLLGILLEGRVDVLEALRLTRGAAGNVHYWELIGKAEDAVIRGESISSALATTDLVSPSVYEAVRNGERSGRLGHLLLTVADFLDEDNEIVLRSLTTIMEPAILILLGILVGFVAVSMFTPLFDLTAMAQGGGM